MVFENVLGLILNSKNIWIQAFSACLLISVLPNLLLFFIPSSWLSNDMKSRRKVNIQNIFLCFAAGGLLGDVFLHIIPHLIGGHSHDDHDDNHKHEECHDHEQSHHSSIFASATEFDHHHHDHDDEHDHSHQVHDDHHDDSHAHSHSNIVSSSSCASASSSSSAPTWGVVQFFWNENRTLCIGLLILLGFVIFVAVDRLARVYSRHKHSHSHSQASIVPAALNNVSSKPNTNDEVSATHAAQAPSPRSTRSRATTKATAAAATSHTITSSNSSSSSTAAVNKESQAKSIALPTAALLNLIADSMHNFTDGIALGASFATGHGLAVATLLSVLFHEIPHELGDLTVLMKSGYTKWQAIYTQFGTAIAAFVGTFVGLYFQSNEVVEEVMLALCAGGFLFVAFHMMTTVSGEEEDAAAAATGGCTSSDSAAVSGSGDSSSAGTVDRSRARRRTSTNKSSECVSSDQEANSSSSISSSANSSSNVQLLQIFMELSAFCTGVGFMVAVALLEDHHH